MRTIFYGEIIELIIACFESNGIELNSRYDDYVGDVLEKLNISRSFLNSPENNLDVNKYIQDNKLKEKIINIITRDYKDA